GRGRAARPRPRGDRRYRGTVARGMPRRPHPARDHARRDAIQRQARRRRPPCGLGPRLGGRGVTTVAEAFRAGTASDLAVRRAAMAGADLETLDVRTLAPAAAPVIAE